MDKDRYQMDFCINVPEKNYYEDEILAMGGKIYRVPTKSQDRKGFVDGLTQVVRDNGYEYVLRITSNTMGFWDLKVAKKAGAKVCCARSSNSSDGEGIAAKVAHILGNILYRPYVDVAIAPSGLAAEYTFGKKAYAAGKVSILHNAVDLDIFRYDEEARENIRQAFGFTDDTLVVGHVGRFMTQKNHTFLLDIFAQIHKKRPDAKLLLIGKGELEDQIRQKIAALELTESVIFTGIRKDVPKLLSAMDVFVFPSFYEGMPNTVIEAQATGLPCVIADTITPEADITGLVDYVSLDTPAEAWADLASTKAAKPRKNTLEDFIRNGYDIHSATKQFVELIFGDKTL